MSVMRIKESAAQFDFIRSTSRGNELDAVSKRMECVANWCGIIWAGFWVKKFLTNPIRNEMFRFRHGNGIHWNNLF